MKNVQWVFFGLLVTVFACEDNGCCYTRKGSDQLEGTWRLYEVGYSPGDRYITRTIPADPIQRIIFKENYTLSSNIEGLTDYKFFRILNDGSGVGKILALFKQLPGDQPLDPTKLEHSYGMEHKGDELKLYYRFCIEGCHMAFERIQDTSCTDCAF